MSTPQRAAVPQTDNEVQELIANARAAQAVYEAFSQEQVDAIVRDLAKYVYDNAETLARMAVEETGIDDPMHLLQRHAGDDARLVGRQGLIQPRHGNPKKLPIAWKNIAA